MLINNINNILFVEVKSPFHHIFSRTTIPRLGSVLLATILKNNGFKTHVIIEDVKEFTKSMLKDIDMVAISTITSTAPRAYQIADECRAAGLPVVMGGAHVTFLPDEALDHSDYVVRGEGENAILKLLNALNNDTPLHDIHGLSYMRDGKAAHNEKESYINDLDSLPMPDFSLVEAWDSKYVMPFATSRGCPFRCKFCSVIKMFGTKMRYHSVDRVITELKEYVKSTRHVFFCDDNFAANKERAKEIARRIIAEKIPVEWSAQVRVEAARDKELLRLMHKAGCCTVYIGFESINPETLLAFDKKQSVEDIRHSIKTFHKNGIKIHGMFVLGSDNDNVFTIKNTAKFAEETKLDSVQFLVLTPLPGTETYDDMKERGALILDDWRLYDSHHAVFKPKNMSPYELQVEAFKAMGRFYSWKNSFRHMLNPMNLLSFFRTLLRTGSLIEALKAGYFYFFVNIYGREAIRRAFRESTVMIADLKKRLYSEAENIKKMLLPSIIKVKSVIILEETLSKKDQRLFYYFMKNIGVKVRFVQSKMNPADLKNNISTYLKSEVKTLKNKAGMIMMPIIEKPVSAFENICQDMSKELLNNIKNIKLVPMNFANKNPYDFCLNFGLAMNKKLKKINKAYFSALKRVQATKL
ncbi:B12-binding domain-containing radical SAM protein [Thermodesulfobacteriota bacterium]